MHGLPANAIRPSPFASYFALGFVSRKRPKRNARDESTLSYARIITRNTHWDWSRLLCLIVCSQLILMLSLSLTRLEASCSRLMPATAHLRYLACAGVSTRDLVPVIHQVQACGRWSPYGRGQLLRPSCGFNSLCHGHLSTSQRRNGSRRIPLVLTAQGIDVDNCPR